MTEQDLLKRARDIATKVLQTYGEFDDAGRHRFNTEGIWNDHPAVQAALVGLKQEKGNVGMGARATIYNDGSGPDIEVVLIINTEKVAPEKKLLLAAPDGSPVSKGFNLRKGDILIVRVVE